MLNADGRPGVFAIDALVVFNELNNQLLSDPVTGSLPPSAPSSAFYYDVNDDGFITGIDALLIINDINLRPEGEGEFVSALAAADLDGGAPPRSSAAQTKSPPLSRSPPSAFHRAEIQRAGQRGRLRPLPSAAGGDCREPARLADFRSLTAVASGASATARAGFVDPGVAAGRRHADEDDPVRRWVSPRDRPLRALDWPPEVNLHRQPESWPDLCSGSGLFR
jgi:hypothetical protein